MVYYELHVAAELLGKKVRTIRYWVSIGKLKAIKSPTGYRWLVSQEEIERLKGEEHHGNKDRKHSGRAEESQAVCLLDGAGQDSEKSV